MTMRFFDHNATTPLLPEARAAWLDAVESQWLNPSSPYRAAAAVRVRLEAARERLAGLFEITPQRVVFNSGATEGNNAVFAYWAESLDRDTRIGVSPTDHPSVLEAAKYYFGGRIVWLQLKNGVVDTEQCDWSQLSAVSVMAANNETGLLNPWAEIARACRGVKIPFHCDASQWIGKMPLDGLGACEYVTGCAHKFGGPKGTGFLIAPEAVPLGLYGGAQENGRRAGTEDVAGVLAMLAAIEVAETKRATCSDRLKVEFWNRLNEALPRTRRVAENGPTLWNTLSVVLPRFTSSRWVSHLERQGFLLSASSACSTGKEGFSHVLAAMDLNPDEADRVLRISSGWETTEADWEALLEAVLQCYDLLSSEASDSNSQVISI